MKRARWESEHDLLSATIFYSGQSVYLRVRDRFNVPFNIKNIWTTIVKLFTGQQHAELVRFYTAAVLKATCRSLYSKDDSNLLELMDVI